MPFPVGYVSTTLGSTYGSEHLILLLSPLEHFFLSQISIREILHSTKKFPVHCKNIMSEIK